MKQTAVEWLEEQFEESYSYINEIFKETIEQAKEMERQQIIDAYREGCFDNILDENTDKVRAEQYYNETFKNK
jgi:hypothetical protein